MSEPQHPLRPGYRLLARGLGFFVLLAALGFSAQLAAQADKKKRVEEEEDTKAPAKPAKVVSPDEESFDPNAAKPVSPSGAPRSSGGGAVNLADAAKEAKHKAVRELLTALAVPQDIVTWGSSGRQESIRPVGKRIKGNAREYQGPVETLDGKRYTIAGNAAGLEQYEDMALEKVDAFLRAGYDALSEANSERLPRPEVLGTAEKVVASVLLFHKGARERGERRGDGWDEVEKKLSRRLLDIRLDQVGAYSRLGDWPGAYGKARELAEAYPDAKTHEQIRKPLEAMVEDAIRKDHPQAPLWSRLMEDLFPAANRQANEVLIKRAQELYDAAQKAYEKGDRTETERLVKQAEFVWPRLPGLQDFRLKVSNAYPVLRVGVRDLPRKENLSPARAQTDAERLAVDLIFEGLIKPAFDPKAGLGYVPALASGPPRLMPPGRLFQLPRNAFWSNGQAVTAADVSHTVGLLKKTNPALADFVEDVVVGDPHRIPLILRQGYIDPLSLMTFKILPQQPYADHGLNAADDARFAREPIGSGPYVLAGFQRSGNREYAAFKANPNYSSRAGRGSRPYIREIHFYRTTDAAAELSRSNSPDGLDLILDVPTKDLRRIRDGVKDVIVPEPQPGRRITFLAVNHRVKALQNRALRQAITHAIDRESLLKAHFRDQPNDPAHRPLNGPFPPGSWACLDADRLPADPHNAGLAKAKLGEVVNSGNVIGSVRLKYPSGEPHLKAAMEALARQIQNAGLPVIMAPESPSDLCRSVLVTHDYELAYFHHDFESDAYWLWPLFDPRAMDNGGTNYLGFKDAELETLLREAMSYRDPYQVQQRMQVIHDWVNKNVPLIPLWQLDMHVAYVPAVRPVPFDPQRPFNDIEQWRRLAK